MPSEVPFFSYISLYIVSLQIINCNTKSSFHWKLRLEDGKVFGIKPNTLSSDDKENDNRPRVNDLGHMYENEQHKIFDNDPELSDNIGDTVFNILVSTILHKGLWVKKDHGPCIKDCEKPVTDSTETRTVGDSKENKVPGTQNSNSRKEMYSTGDGNRLLCCPEVNYTEYDNLSGVANRHKHPNLPEPDVITFFQKKSTSKKEVNLKVIERQLTKSLKEEPQNINTLQSAGNYWRLKGNTHKSIECFRNILKLQPNDKEALLSLGRILYHLGYLEDAAFLTRRSLELAQNHADAYLHHFTLGEILKAYGHYYEASLYFKQTLVLNPDYQPASDLLKDLQSLPESSVHASTLFIIAFLVLAVLFGVLSTIEVVSRVSDDGCSFSSSTSEVTKTQRHFNRAMAMRSMKLAVNSRPFRFKKSN